MAEQSAQENSPPPQAPWLIDSSALMSGQPPPIPYAPQISPAHLSQIAHARKAFRKIQRAVGMANFDGWSIGIFAGFTLLLDYTSVSSALLGIGMVGVAVVELRTAARLRRLEPGGARTLAFNQLVLATMLVVYALYGLYGTTTSKGAYSAEIAANPGLAEFAPALQDTMRQVSVLSYTALIGIALFAQGGLALYYFSRARLLRRYLAETPEWIMTMQKHGVTL